MKNFAKGEAKKKIIDGAFQIEKAYIEFVFKKIYPPLRRFLIETKVFDTAIFSLWQESTISAVCVLWQKMGL